MAVNLICELLKTSFINLLENKHLYQNITIDIDELIIDLNRDTGIKEIYGSSDGFVKSSWQILCEEQKKASRMRNLPLIEFEIRNVNLWCTTCKRKNPFSLLRVIDIYENLKTIEKNLNITGTQLFAMVFICQGCLGRPETIIVKRENYKISVCGRSPIEEVRVPKFIPKDIHGYYSGAIIARNSGQILAGIFLLRTVIEQYLRGKYKEIGEIDKLNEIYKTGLPDEFNSKFPSLYAIYTILSDALHKANSSDPIFFSEIKKIDEHFDAKRLFKIEN